jgi:hypothetical protein
MGRILIGWSALGVAAGLALQPAHAGDRKSAAVRNAGNILAPDYRCCPGPIAGR